MNTGKRGNRLHSPHFFKCFYRPPATLLRVVLLYISSSRNSAKPAYLAGFMPWIPVHFYHLQITKIPCLRSLLRPLLIPLLRPPLRLLAGLKPRVGLKPWMGLQSLTELRRHFPERVGKVIILVVKGHFMRTQYLCIGVSRPGYRVSLKPYGRSFRKSIDKTDKTVKTHDQIGYIVVFYRDHALSYG